MESLCTEIDGEDRLRWGGVNLNGDDTTGHDENRYFGFLDMIARTQKMGIAA